ncbi:MAG: DNA primase [Gammaproteobacteria bacterium]
MSAADRLLARLEGVRETGAGRWIACCPAHKDKSPSLSIRELSDGRVLLHDFGACETLDVLGAVGLELKDLYPDSLPNPRRERYGPSRDRIHPADALRCVSHEATLVAIVASSLAEGRTVTAADADRVALAAGRIRGALDVTGVSA